MARNRDEARAQRMHRWYLEGFSLSQVGALFGVTRQTVHETFCRYDLARREKKRLPATDYGGRRYTPDSDGYLRCTDGDRHYLHQRIWTEANGPIPPGREIHHHDENKQNNDIENLACLTANEHGVIHKPLAVIAERRCLHCGQALVRRRYPCGRLEEPGAIGRRLYCDAKCKGQDSRGRPRGNRRRPSEVS